MYLKLAIKEASKARHRHQLAAIILRGGKPISIGHNHSLVHAEHAAINRAWRSDINGATIIVIRVRKDGSFGMAMPCDMCMARLVSAGIRKVIYTDSSGILKSIKLPSKVNVPPPNMKFRVLMWDRVAHIK